MKMMRKKRTLKSVKERHLLLKMLKVRPHSKMKRIMVKKSLLNNKTRRHLQAWKRPKVMSPLLQAKVNREFSQDHTEAEVVTRNVVIGEVATVVATEEIEAAIEVIEAAIKVTELVTMKVAVIEVVSSMKEEKAKNRQKEVL
jgi:hypothetical protein